MKNLQIYDAERWHSVEHLYFKADINGNTYEFTAVYFPGGRFEDIEIINENDKKGQRNLYLTMNPKESKEVLDAFWYVLDHVKLTQ